MAVRKRSKSLAQGRPPIAALKERMSSQRSRTIIRSHHRLQKEHAAAIKKGDPALAERIAKAIEENGGLKVYQAASKQGQSKDRGGDSSNVLVEWLQQAKVIQSRQGGKDALVMPQIRCLEIGALSTKNAISTKFTQHIEMTRIDLNSQGPGIEQQDFMERPLPKSPEDRFDIISLSLVLNYAPDPVQRGEMLKRVTDFLEIRASEGSTETMLPALFLVLPLPCVDNSRYLDEQLLMQIMTNLGFTMLYKKKTLKLCYYLFKLSSRPTPRRIGKRQVKDGRSMNNFCIVIK